jgi:protein-S-isoprenylcysteine O-methyltransferase Ste14
MNAAALRAVLALPVNVLVVIPALLLWWTGSLDFAEPVALRFWLAPVCFTAGLMLMVRTIGLFTHVGEGTLAPWNPTQNLVVVGVYRHVRNPMISGVLANLLGEALLFGSWPLFAWFAVFLAGNALYMPLFEEPGLEARFGEDYRRYKANVPRWIPRLTPYEETPSESSQD